MATKIISVSDLKSKLTRLLEELKADGTPLYVIQHGKPKAVLVKYEDFEAMLEKKGDLEDILVMLEALSSPEDEAITLEDYERQRGT